MSRIIVFNEFPNKVYTTNFKQVYVFQNRATMFDMPCEQSSLDSWSIICGILCVPKANVSMEGMACPSPEGRIMGRGGESLPSGLFASHPGLINRFATGLASLQLFGKWGLFMVSNHSFCVSTLCQPAKFLITVRNSQVELPLIYI